MPNDELSLETRASSAYVQGRLIAVLSQHESCAGLRVSECTLKDELRAILNEWKKAQTELKVQKESK